VCHTSHAAQLSLRFSCPAGHGLAGGRLFLCHFSPNKRVCVAKSPVPHIKRDGMQITIGHNTVATVLCSMQNMSEIPGDAVSGNNQTVEKPKLTLALTGRVKHVCFLLTALTAVFILEPDNIIPWWDCRWPTALGSTRMSSISLLLDGLPGAHRNH
jgi:hypothetical protein